MEKIPVNIISGFLGSGKTTAIMRLLNQKKDDGQWAVLVNEFGEISIDGDTLRSSSHAETVYTISGGCICCSAQGYFFENLLNIARSGIYSRILIEPSGLGGIDLVCEVVRQIPGLSLMPVICMVDMAGLENPRHRVNPVYRAQVAKSEVIVFSKADLVPNAGEQERLAGKFKESFPGKTCWQAVDNRLLGLIVPGLGEDRHALGYFRRDEDLPDKNYAVKNYAFGPDMVFDVSLLGRLFAATPEVVRVKGHVRAENGWKLFNFTSSGFDSATCPGKKQNELVVISEKLKTDTGFFNDFHAEIKRVIVDGPL